MGKIEEIRRKLDLLREMVDFNTNLEVFSDANGNADLFDVISHRYQLGPCLSEAEIASIEKRFAIALPDEYRTFLLEIGNGGAGPYYDLYTLLKGIEIAERKGKLDRVEHVLAQQFPLTKPFIRPEFAGKAAIDTFLENVNLPDHVQGALPVADFGCGINTLLIITGEARGTLWLDDRHSDNGIWPLCMVDDKVDFSRGFDIGYEGSNQTWEGCDFLTWYEAWLDERIDIHTRYKNGEWHAPWTEARRNLNHTSIIFGGKTNDE